MTGIAQAVGSGQVIGDDLDWPCDVAVPDDLDIPADPDDPNGPRFVSEQDEWDAELDALLDRNRFSRVDTFEWELWDGHDQDQAERELLRRTAPPWVLLPPGGDLATALEQTRPEAMSPMALIELMKAADRLTSWAEAIKATAMASFYRQRQAEHRESPRPTQLDTNGRPIDPERSWYAEIALALGLSPNTVGRRVDTALRLTSTLSATHTALRCGALTWGKALAISEATSQLPDPAAQAVQAHVLKRAPGQTHRNLQHSLRRQVAKHTSREMAEAHRAANADRTCKIVPLSNGMAGLWIVHTSDKIQQIWIAIQAMATLAKRGTPTTAPTPGNPNTTGVADPLHLTRPDGPACAGGGKARPDGTVGRGVDEPRPDEGAAGRGDGQLRPDEGAAGGGDAELRPDEGAAGGGDAEPRTHEGAAGRGDGQLRPDEGAVGRGDAELRPDEGAAGRGDAEPRPDEGGVNGDAAPKDARTAEQRRADVAADLFEHILHNGLDWLGRRLPDQHRRRPHIEVVVPAATLLGLDNDPAELTGYGPIPAEMARRIAADGTWRRLLTDPTNGIVLEASTTRHDPGTLVTETLLARHPVCAWPGCNRTSRDCDRDHLTPFARSGATTLSGLAPYCEYHHVIKDTPTWGWTTTSHPDGTITLTTPSGHRHTTVPPARGPITQPPAAETSRAAEPIRAATAFRAAELPGPASMAPHQRVANADPPPF
ncbi:DUF222 domain-containing protein [Kribbella sp. NPDC050281]|uniref:DUF222 domain-containing protein n=1 Tax=Kribbella sp. NPDC050281 TaxID=3155515 RepID=UPI0033C2C131